MAKERREPGRCGNSHVTAVDTGADPRTGADDPKGRRHLGSQAPSDLHGQTVRAVLATRVQRLPSEGGGSEGARERQGCQRLGSKRSDGRRGRLTNLGGVRQSESGVVKRQFHRSLGRGCKPGGQGRGASLEEKPVMHEARVLVVQESWEAEIGRTCRALSPSQAARRATGGKASSKQTVER